MVTVTVVAALAGALTAGCGSEPRAPAAPPSASTPRRGGAVIASIRTDPRSFNRLAAGDSSTDLVSELTQAKLVRINHATQEVEPWLAESWTSDEDGRRYVMRLRRGVTFSDGAPFTAADVLFTFKALYDPRAGSVLADALKVDGKPLRVAAPDPHTLVVTFPSPFAPGVRILDNVPILPRHRLERALEAGTFADAWGIATPPADLAGAGPFVLTQYAPGQRLVFDRNPKYWRRAADGTALPYLDRITIEIIPDQNAELLRLEVNQIDMMNSEVAPEAYATVKRAADEGRLRLLDLGVALQADSFWFNLKPGALGDDPRAAWLQRDELRRAVSLAVDRQLFADTVFLGAAEPVYGPITSSNKKWYWPDLPKTPHDLAGAKALLATIGLADRDGDGALEDAGGRPARFTILTQRGRPRLERGAAVVRDELRKIGLVADVVALDGNAVIERIQTAKYDAVYFSAVPSDTDPAVNQDFWFSSGAFHLWNLAEPSPATAWERTIDELMARQIATPDEAERRRLFIDVLRIFAEHQPVLYFAAPRYYLAVSSRLTNLTPAIFTLPVLWAADTVAVTE